MKKFTNKKTILTSICAILVVTAMIFTFAACDGNKDKEPTKAPSSETETAIVPVIEEVTDEAGEPVTDANGEKVTEVVGTTTVVVDKGEEIPSFVQKPTETTTKKPTEKPTEAPTTTTTPTAAPTVAPTAAPTEAPTKAPTAAPTERPTEAPTQKPTEAPETQPSGGGGGLDMSDAGKGPNTDHVGGESSDEAHQAAQDAIEENGWDMDWELN